MVRSRAPRTSASLIGAVPDNALPPHQRGRTTSEGSSRAEQGSQHCPGRIGQYVQMIRLLRKEKCARCGSVRDVKVVTYVRREQRDQKLSEPWCRKCRRAKLVKQS